MALAAILVFGILSPGLAQDHRHDGGHHREHPRSQADHEKPGLGEPVKPFVVTDSTGRRLDLAELRASDQRQGKIVVLTFWCTMCHSCREIDKDLDRKASHYKDQGVEFLVVASNHIESAERVNRFLEHNRLTFPVLMDAQGEIARYFGATVTTTTAVIDPQGRLRYYGRFPEAEDSVRSLLAGEEVAVPETPTMGCMILFKPQSDDDAADDKAHPHRDDHGHRRQRHQ